MHCNMKQPTLVADGDLSDDLTKLVHFILHGVYHQLEDGLFIPTVYFVGFDNNTNMAVINAADLDSDDASEVVQAIVKDKQADIVAYVTEAWALPVGTDMTGYASVKDHPLAEDVLLINIEERDAVWSTKIIFKKEGTVRSLPETIEFERVPDEKLGSDTFMRMIPVQTAPAGMLLH